MNVAFRDVPQGEEIISLLVCPRYSSGHWECNGEQTNKIVALILVGKDTINKETQNTIISENNTFHQENEIERL